MLLHGTIFLDKYLAVLFSLSLFFLDGCCCAWEKIYSGFIVELLRASLPPPSPSFGRAFVCHPLLTVTPLSSLLLFMHLCFLLHLSADFPFSLILFTSAAHSIILSSYIFVCPSFSLHLFHCARERWRDGSNSGEGRDGRIM